MKVRAFVWLVLAVIAGWDSLGFAQPAGDIRELKLRDWQPRSMLKTRQNEVETPAYPVIDVHNHLGGGKDRLTAERVKNYLAEMDAAGIRTVVNLDGGWGRRLNETLAALDEAHPGRFLTFALLDFRGIDDENWGRREAKRLEESFRAGAKGLKIHKSLGLNYRYSNGKLMPVDDPRLDPVWQTCARYGRPVVIHVADPAAFFTPLDRFNERWHELGDHPNWLFHGDEFPSHDEILAQRNRAIARHPETTFICAHFGNNPEDLATVGKWLDRYPNMVVDVDARISELGRQPYTARKFFLKYQDRIMFGTDTTPRRDAYRMYYRFLETDDEYFDCAGGHQRQGFWMIYGLFLPKDVLEKVYRTNAERLFFGRVDAPQEPAGKVLRIRRTEDFAVSGAGDAPAWEKAAWESLNLRRSDGHQYKTRVKMLYSATGLYVLMEAEDGMITATMKEDFLNLWEEDVFEFFLWPDERYPVYFEYEISPLGFELPIIIPNFGGEFLGWRPWHYDGKRKTQTATTVTGGSKQSGAKVTGWKAEVFVPYDLLSPLKNVPPQPGTHWRANFYRVDYDEGKTTSWDWARVGSGFHEFEKFGTLIFE
ncbi:MAG TPA: amidohydrolase family protein [Sedimentisphaerales bacterium]|nr:amidohydrolase family protein [Sedimentisphaerales bacterium]